MNSSRAHQTSWVTLLFSLPTQTFLKLWRKCLLSHRDGASHRTRFKQISAEQVEEAVRDSGSRCYRQNRGRRFSLTVMLHTGSGARVCMLSSLPLKAEMLRSEKHQGKLSLECALVSLDFYLMLRKVKSRQSKRPSVCCRARFLEFHP